MPSVAKPKQPKAKKSRKKATKPGKQAGAKASGWAPDWAQSASRILGKGYTARGVYEAFLRSQTNEITRTLKKKISFEEMLCNGIQERLREFSAPSRLERYFAPKNPLCPDPVRSLESELRDLLELVTYYGSIRN